MTTEPCSPSTVSYKHDLSPLTDFTEQLSRHRKLQSQASLRPYCSERWAPASMTAAPTGFRR